MAVETVRVEVRLMPAPDDTAAPWPKGPWRVVIDDTGGEFTGWPSISAPPEADITIIHRAGFKQEFWAELSKRDAIAVARLIAAAPSLYEVVRLVAEHFADTDAPLGIQARAALALARGETK